MRHTETIDKTPTNTIPEDVFDAYGLPLGTYVTTPITTGHINRSFLLTSLDGSRPPYVLQNINTYVFKNPEYIAQNITAAATHLHKNYPDYFFVCPIATRDGRTLYIDTAGTPWRISPYVERTKTINTVKTAKEANSAAFGFGLLTHHLADAPVVQFAYTIPRFHDASFRYEEFTLALENATDERRRAAEYEIRAYTEHASIVRSYVKHIQTGVLRERIFHHDTKINNILFDTDTNEARAVVDLDTLMPGYFISDVGDMIRTFVGVYENERDLSKVVVRDEIYDALVEGYLTAMGSVLTMEEKKLIPFSGLLITFMLGLRMLTDHLHGDVYFRVEYPGQNLDRAKNQLRLLELLIARG